MKVLAFIGLVVALTAMGQFIGQVNLDKGTNVSDFGLSNLKVLNAALAEGGSSSKWECYSRVDNCWFWGCWDVYLCGNPCTTVSVDYVSLEGRGVCNSN